jgi:hypothetical protein
MCGNITATRWGRGYVYVNSEERWGKENKIKFIKVQNIVAVVGVAWQLRRIRWRRG